MKQSPRKALIPVAGRGTRFLPATKTVAKELFPLVDKPQLLLIVEEAVGAGVEEIILISGPHKKAVEDFFKVDAELEDFLQSKGELDLVERLKKISSLAIIKIAQQDDPKGLGHAVYSGKKLIGNEPFYVLLGDEIIYSPEDSSLALRDLQQSFIETKASTVTLMKVPKEQVNRYGIADVKDPSFVPQKISSLIEKPSIEESPSQWALPGRYLFTPEIFSLLENLPAGRNNEIQLTDAINLLCQSQGVFGVALNKALQRFDAGDKFGFIQANIEIALNHAEVSEKMKAYILDRAQRLQVKN